MIINERDIRHQLVVEAARRMMTAARTAPKAKGCDILEIALVDSCDDLNAIAEQMHREYESNGMQFLLRDADNILQGEALLLIGTRRQPQGLNCGYCGKPTCAQNPAPAPCAFNSIAVGIAGALFLQILADPLAIQQTFYSLCFIKGEVQPKVESRRIPQLDGFCQAPTKVGSCAAQG